MGRTKELLDNENQFSVDQVSLLDDEYHYYKYIKKIGMLADWLTYHNQNEIQLI